MKSLLIPAIVAFLLLKLLSHKSSSINQGRNVDDTVFVQVPEKFDTAHIKYSNPGVTRVVLEKHNFDGFEAKGAATFDINWTPDFAIKCENESRSVAARSIAAYQLSDSVSMAGRAFFKRHTFFVIISKQDTCFFYKAVGNYMNTNLENDVK